MKGEIGFDSNFGAGSCFWFTARLEERAANLSEAASATALAGLRTLIVVANGTVRRHLLQQTMILGLDSKGVACGSEAIEMLRRASADGAPFAIAFIDHGLPDVNGLTLVRAIRADPCVADICVVSLASLSELMDAEGLQAEGIDMQLTKPVKQTQVGARLSQALRANESPATTLARAPHPPAEHAVTDAPAPHQARVLLAEDDSAIRKALSLMLGVMGYDVVAVANGVKALEAYQTGNFDLILMDCHMPEIDGWEASTHIRRGEGPGLHVPIIGITGYVLESDRARCLEAGMDECLTKPVSMDRLSFILEHHLAASRTASPGVSTTQRPRTDG
jgi:CheY-like chemotaxis protein